MTKSHKFLPRLAVPGTVLIGVLGMSATLTAQALYTPHDLGTLGGSSSYALAVNNSGVVVGCASLAGDTALHPFVWTQAGGMVDIGTLGGTSACALAISGNGVVAGYSSVTGEAPLHAFAWTRAGGMVDLGTLGGNRSQATAVSASGMVVGESSLPGSGVGHAFAWTQADGMIDLGTLDGDDYSKAVAVNAGGMVLGQSWVLGAQPRAFVWTRTDGMIDLGTLGGSWSIPTGLNDSGMAVGRSALPDGVPPHAFAWTQTGGMVNLGALVGNTYSYAMAVNGDGKVVGGSCTDTSLVHCRAFAWTGATGIIDLGTGDGSNTEATSVNESGEVVGYGSSGAFAWTNTGGLVYLPAFGGLSYALAVNDDGLVVGYSATPQDHATVWTVLQPPPTTGTISVTTNLPGALFTLTGPAIYNGSGTSFIATDVPAGSYSISFGSVLGYSTPSGESKALAAGGQVAFSGTYVLEVTDSDGDGVSDAFDLCSGTAVGVAVKANGCPYVEGAIGIWDGSQLWPLDGIAVSINYVRAKTPAGVQVEQATILNGGKFRFPSLVPGNYIIDVGFSYSESVASNTQSCGDGTFGNAGAQLTKQVEAHGFSVAGSGWDFLEIRLPPPVVLVHGIVSDYTKWFSNQGISQANTWDDVLRRNGYISFTPNYDSLIQLNWFEVEVGIGARSQIELHSITSAATTSRYPPWALVGHSQGGLAARVLARRNPMLTSTLRQVFMVGTPNDGARLDAVVAGSCFDYLTENTMQRNFNYAFPDLAGRPAWAFAGTGSFITGASDGIVKTKSVHNITCKNNLCNQKKALTIPGSDYPFTHDSLGSETSVEILTNEIMTRMARPSIDVRRRQLPRGETPLER